MEGLPTLPSYVFEINTLLGSPSVDLDRLGKVIRNDPSLSAQVLRMCNSASLNDRRRVLSVEEAAILMGSERLRTLVLTCSIMEFTGRQLPRSEVRSFWRHSFMTGMLSERIAKWIGYTESEQAYLAGLLHDVGTLPLLMVAQQEEFKSGQAEWGRWGGTLEDEKDFFGMSHCEVGRRIGQFWNFPHSFIDVFENHHHPARSICDPGLVGIVAAAEHFCEVRSLDYWIEDQELAETARSSEDEFLSACLPRLDRTACWELTEMLETEYLHLLPAIEFNNSAEHPAARRNG